MTGLCVSARESSAVAGSQTQPGILRAWEGGWGPSGEASLTLILIL